MLDPTTFLRRTPLRRVLPADVAWASVGDAAIAGHVGTRTSLGDLALADLSPLPRLGFKGKGTMAAMRARGVALEPEPNRAFRQADGGLCVVLGPGEVLLLGNLDGQGGRLAGWESDWRIEAGERTYPLPRRDSHAWLAVAGIAAPAMLAKLCAIDFRLHRFADLAVAQTSLAQLNAILVRADAGAVPIFHLLADSASSAYLLACLLDAAAEWNGVLVGQALLQAIGGRRNGER